MNWLAHLYLSEPTPEFRLGSILPDMVSTRELAGLPEEFQRGIRRHRQIDAFTDAHPVFRRSVQRFKPPLRRFGGILVDVFYDHFLARDWARYSATPLPEFAAEFYASFPNHRSTVSPAVYSRLEAMQADDLLGSYVKVEGIAEALRRISMRLRRPVDLVPAMAVLEKNEEVLQGDFSEFFGELTGHVFKEERQKNGG